MADLPDTVAALAYRSSNGELAWRRENIPTALSAIAESGQALLGGEVWVSLGEGQWHGGVPPLDGGLPGIWHWETAPRRVEESWAAYCHRTAKESARAVAELRVEEEAAPAVRDRLFFNLTYVTENDD